MWLRRFEIQGFRNIAKAELNPSEGYNLITGANGSGKSSILESIYCLSTGRSFRTNKKLPIIQYGLAQATVFGEIVAGGDIVSRAGLLKRRDGSSHIRLDGRNIDSQTELALILPVLGTTPESEDLLSEGAKVRQAYLDWTLFHVEPSFREIWRNYRRALHQRNRALKGRFDSSAVRTWDTSLITTGLEVNRLRKGTLARLVPIVTEILGRLLPGITISFAFRQGWPKDLHLVDSIDQSYDVDRKMGFTHAGPHRADVVIKTDLGPPSQIMSRGQKKCLLVAMKIAQALDYYHQTGNLPILYIDDLPAELDLPNRQRVMQELLSLDTQIFITATSKSDMECVASPCKLFHVEQGCVSDMV